MKQFSIGLILCVSVLGCGESPESRTEAEETDTEAKDTSELDAARRRKVAIDIVHIDQALSQYFINNLGVYPDTLEALVTNDDNGMRYLNQTVVPKDPWGNEYIYEKPNPGEDPDVISYGGDGQPGGEGEDADSTLIEIKGR